MKVSLAVLRSLTEKALHKYGYNDVETAAMAEVMLYAQTRGNNQGVVKLTGAGMPKSPDAGEVEIIKETKVSAYLDAHQNPAMVVIGKAVDIAIQKAHESGIAIVGVNGINTSSGALGFYVHKIADDGLVGLVFAGSMETVAAEGSFEAIFGTNPFAIGVPGAEGSLVLDMATAAMAYYGVVEANTAGRKLPKDIAYDRDGALTDEPAKVLDGGALRTFDKNYKGSNLSMMVQALTGPLVGAAFMSIGDESTNWGGHLIIAIDPDVLAGVEPTRKHITEMVAKIKATKKLPGVDEILVAGERGDRVAAAVEKSGEIEIEDNLYKALQKAAEA